MRETNTIIELISERGKKRLPLERLYRLLFNRNLYLEAYGKIYRNAGAMTHGVTDETPDGMSLEKIDAIIEALRYERYQWLPARRVYIPKKNGKKTPARYAGVVGQAALNVDATPRLGKSTTSGAEPTGSLRETSRNASTSSVMI
jgi:hypothetical protein